MTDDLGRAANHMMYLRTVAEGDIVHLEEKEKTYQGSWKKRGGVGAFMMLARKWDRIENLLGSLFNVFAHIEAKPDGSDGTVLAEIRDLRRYLLLVEAEMVARGVVTYDTGSLTNEMTGRKTGIGAEQQFSGIPVLTVGDPPPSSLSGGSFVDRFGFRVVEGDLVGYSEPTYDMKGNVTWNFMGRGVVSNIRQGMATISYKNGVSSYKNGVSETVDIVKLRKIHSPVPAEDSNRHADRVPRPGEFQELRSALNDYEYNHLPIHQRIHYLWRDERQEWVLKK